LRSHDRVLQSAHVPVYAWPAVPLSSPVRAVLRGRRDERAELDRVLTDVRAGASGVLVLRGEAGIGKSTLLEHCAHAAADLRVLRCSGVEAEMELAFAGLHQLCAPLVERLADLPAPQREALGTAFGLTAGPPPDAFLVGLAVLGLLSGSATARPVVCLVDDAQWLDRASLEALAFVGRRLLADAVAMVFATRETADVLAGFPELAVEGLPEAEARALLDSVVGSQLDAHVRDRIVAEAAGNPLALIELPRGFTTHDLAGGFALPDAPLSGRIEASFRQRVEPLPASTRRLIVLAAADPVGDTGLLWRAAATLGIEPDAGPAERAGLLRLGARVTFSHPLARSAVYRAASEDQRREAHGALAEATDPDLDPDRRAWHQAAAVAGPDEAVAAQLEQSAGRAQARGGLAATAAFLERAAMLTPDAARRAARALDAARAKHDAGAPEGALELLAMAELGPLDDVQLARAERLRADVAFAQRRGADAPPLLLRAARRLEPLDPALARETYLDALAAAITTGDRDSLTPAARALEAATPRDEMRPAELLPLGQALVLIEGRPTGLPILKKALAAFRSEPQSPADELRWLAIGALVAISLWDDESWHVLSGRQVRLGREAGALAVLPLALEMHAASHIHAGDFATAQALLDEAVAVCEATGSAPLVDGPLLLLAWRGDEAPALARIESGIRDAAERGEESGITSAEYAAAVLFNGLSRHDEALTAAQRSCEHHPARSFTKALIEMAEAGVRCGREDVAATALAQLAEATTPSGTDWALGVEARTRALLAGPDSADQLYAEALERLGRTRARVDLARTHLLYGEWLRRQRRRVDARRHLRDAHDTFTAMGADAFAARAARELLATGETARKRTPEATDQLTPQEAHIARLARDNLSNPQIGARLFISPRTVEYHLGKVFTKLGISSRNELAIALPGEAREPEPVP
jgi:DNA-binding CsgD family transcriptional regulator